MPDPDTRGPSAAEPRAWAAWPTAVTATANATVFHISKGEPVAALELIDELLSDLGDRRRTIAELANAAD